MKQQSNGHFETSKPGRPARSLLLSVLLLLSLLRLGAEGCKLLNYADLFIGGGKLLIYSDLDSVDLKKEGSEISIVTDISQAKDDNTLVKLNDGATVVYHGHTYELNRDLATVLLLGIDHSVTDEAVPGEGGQSDVILLVALDTESGTTKVLNISREANAQVDVYSADNNWIETRFEQITLAYAYGNGRDTSCENTVRAVSRLLYGLPIGSYLSVDMAGIRKANELVGGVQVPSLIDIRLPDGTTVREGDQIELHGDNLERYIRYRDEDLHANARRMERQKQYITAFSKLFRDKTQENTAFPSELFSAMSSDVVTNLELSDIAFLSSTYLRHGTDFKLLTLDGSFDRYHGSTIFNVDESSLLETVLEIFYRQVD